MRLFFKNMSNPTLFSSDAYVHAQLNGQGINHVRHFVEKGSTYKNYGMKYVKKNRNRIDLPPCSL